MSIELKEKILSIYRDYSVGVFSTIDQSRPFARFMMFFHEDLTLYTATNKHTHKVEELKKNPYVHVLLGNSAQQFDSPYIEVEAKASFEESPDLKTQFWTEHLNKWIESPDDPNYVLLKLEPEKILYFPDSGSEPEIFTM